MATSGELEKFANLPYRPHCSGRSLEVSGVGEAGDDESEASESRLMDVDRLTKGLVQVDVGKQLDLMNG